MTRLAVRQRIGGVVIDGLTRDSVHTFTERTLPILFRGLSPVDIKGRGRVAATDVPITIDGLRITPQTFVFMDGDALVAVPSSMEAVLAEQLTTNLRDEADVICLIDQGASVADILKRVNEF